MATSLTPTRYGGLSEVPVMEPPINCMRKTTMVYIVCLKQSILKPYWTEERPPRRASFYVASCALTPQLILI